MIKDQIIAVYLPIYDLFKDHVMERLLGSVGEFRDVLAKALMAMVLAGGG